MVKYLDCLKTNGSASTPCRVLGKDYLDCRMNRCAWLRLDWGWMADGSQGAHGTRRLEKSWDGEPGQTAERVYEGHEGHWAVEYGIVGRINALDSGLKFA